MVSSIPISLSGLQASQKNLLAASSNIANLTTSGVNPETSKDGQTTAYNAKTVVQKTLNIQGQGGVGTAATIVEREDGTTLISDPNSIFADKNGLIAIPNISLEEEVVNLLTAKIAYKANAFAFKTAQEIEQSLIDELA